MSKVTEAVSTLEELGLTEYEARCFVALARVSEGTAKEVSSIADVPRARVYDTIERLDRKGLVDVQQSTPRKYKAVPTEVAFRRLRENYDSRIEAAENALRQVEEPDSDEDEGMWAITSAEQVTDRIVAILDGADEAVHHLVAAEEVLDRAILDALAAAADRGVRVLVEVPTEDAADRIEQAVPDAEVEVAPTLDSTEPVYGEWPAQLLLVDRQATVAAGLEESGLPEVSREAAVWTYGNDHGFAVWVRELLDDRVERSDAGD